MAQKVELAEKMVESLPWILGGMLGLIGVAFLIDKINTAEDAIATCAPRMVDYFTWFVVECQKVDWGSIPPEQIEYFVGR